MSANHRAAKAARLRQVYRAYGVASQTLPAGAMLGHSDIAFVVDQRGHLVQELNVDPGPGTAITGICPSLDLGFSPVTATRDGGSWSSLPPEPGFADVPDALAATADGRLIALDQDQAVQAAVAQQASWSALTTTKTLAATAAGRRCSLARLTAVAYTPAGSPLLAGICGRAGTAGVFARQGGTWQLAGPALP
jgi:hypothetical protein